jgi:hypothetical protein
MKIPGPQASIAFCSKLHYKLTCVKSEEYAYWLLEEENGLSSTWPSLLELWVELARRAAYLLHEDRKFKAFMDSYRRASANRRLAMRRWAMGVPAGLVSDTRMDLSLNMHRRPSIDHLPRDWKAKFARLRSLPDGETLFPHRAKRELKKTRSGR